MKIKMLLKKMSLKQILNNSNILNNYIYCNYAIDVSKNFIKLALLGLAS